MIVITRKDGRRFIAQVYRERIVLTNRRLLIQEIQLLSTQHGLYLNLSRHAERAVDVAVSQEPGYLLGESVWDYFGRPQNLIFCEALKETAQCLLVVIRDGAVYLDMRLVSSEIYTELLPIFADTVRYDIYTFGDVPLRDCETFGDATFQVPKKNRMAFSHLKEPIFEHLLVSPEFELQPLPLALRSKYVRRPHVLYAVLSTFVLLACAGWYFGTSSSPETVAEKAISPVASSMQPYEVALSSPKPSAIITELADNVAELYLIPGWQVAHLKFGGGDQYQVDLQAQGGNLWYLTDWAKQHYYDLHIIPGGATLTLESHLAKRTLVNRYPLIQVTADTLLTRLREVLMDDAIHIDSSSQDGTMQQTKLTLDLKEISPDLLDLIGQELESLPLSVSSIDLYVKDGFIDGTIQLSLWGK